MSIGGAPCIGLVEEVDLADAELDVARFESVRVVGVEPVESEPMETAPVEEQKPQSGFALDRLLAEGETATVLLTRMPNNRLLKVNYKGAERICMCKDSRFFVPGMVIPVRLDGDNLVAKFQPRRLGKF